MTTKILNTEALDVEETLNDIEHFKFHIDGLSYYFPDLMVARTGDNDTMEYFSGKINPTANHVEFTTSTSVSYAIIHYVAPYKEIDIDCKFCQKPIPVRTNPGRFPLFMKHGSDYNFAIEKMFHTYPFDEFIKQYKLPKYVLSQCRTYILDCLKKETLADYQEVFITNSIKRLMIFT
jgi:hypothetical protein